MTKNKATEKWSSGELAFMTYWRQVAPDLPEPEHDVKFHPSRNWRFDFVWSGAKVAVEIEGGIFANGRHTRGSGYEGDCTKYNAALDLGFIVYRYSTGMLERDPFGCMTQIAQAVKARTPIEYRGDLRKLAEYRYDHAA